MNHPPPPLSCLVPTFHSSSTNIGPFVRTLSAHSCSTLLTSPCAVKNTRGAHGSENKGMQMKVPGDLPPNPAEFEYYLDNPPPAPACAHCASPYLPASPLDVVFLGPLSHPGAYDPEGSEVTLQSIAFGESRTPLPTSTFTVRSLPLSAAPPPDIPCTRCRGVTLITGHTFPSPLAGSALPATLLQPADVERASLFYHLPVRKPPHPAVKLQDDAVLGIALSYLVPHLLKYEVHSVQGNAKYAPVKERRRGDGGEGRNGRRRGEREARREWREQVEEEGVGAGGLLFGGVEEGGDY